MFLFLEQIKNGIENNMSKQFPTISSKYLKIINEHPLVSIQEEKDLAEEIKQGNHLALHTLINSNLKLVRSIVLKEFSFYKISIDELIIEGNYGLFLAAQKFDPIKYKTKFSTFASDWIRYKIYSHIAKFRSVIRIPHNSYLKYKKIKSTIQKLKDAGINNPTYKQIEEQCGISELVIKRFLNCLTKEIEFDRPIESEDNQRTNMYNLYGVEEQPKYILDSEKSEVQNIIKESLDTILNTREKDIIIKRFGLFGCQPMTLEEICKNWNCTRERIRQLENISLKKLRKYLKEGRRHNASSIKKTATTNGNCVRNSNRKNETI